MSHKICDHAIQSKGIAASKKKGMWMGGQPSLGYDVKDRKLIVNQQEAEAVRYIFRPYTELKSVRELKDDSTLPASSASVRPGFRGCGLDPSGAAKRQCL